MRSQIIFCSHPNKHEPLLAGSDWTLYSEHTHTHDHMLTLFTLSHTHKPTYMGLKPFKGPLKSLSYKSMLPVTSQLDFPLDCTLLLKLTHCDMCFIPQTHSQFIQLMTL